MANKVYIFRQYLKDINKVDDLRDLLAISLMIKLRYGSSQMWFKNIKGLVKELGISERKFYKLKKSPLFDNMFSIKNGTMTAKCLHRPGLRVGFERSKNSVRVIAGEQTVMEEKIESLKSCNKTAAFLDRVSVAILIMEQEYAGHSGRGDYPDRGAHNFSVKSGSADECPDELIYATKSYMRFSDLTGMGLTKIKKTIRRMVETGEIYKHRNSFKALDLKGNIPEGMKERLISDFINSKEPVYGLKYFRTNDGVVGIRANSYRMRRCVDMPMLDKRGPNRKRTKRLYPAKLTMMEENDLNFFGPDKIGLNGNRFATEKRLIVDMDKDGVITTNVMDKIRVSGGFFQKHLDKRTKRRLAQSWQIMKALGERNIVEQIERVTGRIWTYVDKEVGISSLVAIAMETIQEFNSMLRIHYKLCGSFNNASWIDAFLKVIIEHDDTNKSAREKRRLTLDDLLGYKQYGKDMTIRKEDKYAKALFPVLSMAYVILSSTRKGEKITEGWLKAWIKEKRDNPGSRWNASDITKLIIDTYPRPRSSRVTRGIRSSNESVVSLSTTSDELPLSSPAVVETCGFSPSSILSGGEPHY